MNSGQHQTKTASKGVYFLSNNLMLDLTIAFLNSFRTYNPLIPLCLVPYNKDFDKIEELKHTYRFDIFPDKELLNECDRISLGLHERVIGAYRKLALWEGIYDEFIYIDIDTVVLDDVSFVFEFLKEYDWLNATSNLAKARQFVWLDGIEQCNILDAEQIAYAANMGFIASRKGFMDFEYIKNGLEKARLIEDYMELKCLEQAFLNYLVVTSGKPYTSLSLLADSEKDRKVMSEYWGGDTTASIRGGKIYPKTGKPALFIHWAGVWRLKDQMPNKKIWDYYRNMKAPGNDIARKDAQTHKPSNWLSALFARSGK